ncbi:MAG TPA: hypothetical protein VE861_06435, partial [Gemmatimonadaceae bacterium]|nr:hypothetical protein [Gemmatimonadaceae bacterium]
MIIPFFTCRRIVVGTTLGAATVLAAAGVCAQTGTASPNGPSTALRPMTWLDVQNLRQLGTPVTSPDGKSALYTLSVPDWKEARRQSDLFIVSTTQGVASTRRLTYTNEKSETAPTWSRDGRFFAFLSDRDATANAAATATRGSTLPTNGPGMQYLPQAAGGGTGSATSQLFMMRPDGGEARRITDARDGVSTYAFSPSGRIMNSCDVALPVPPPAACGRYCMPG